ncbi:hypothetical protein [Leptospira limi]|uniref:Uncharacterized protein n=1 Tax=Leptospira limi TaxID=2950023 RepID=A0ABT3LYL9_9LEPT|nr:hypothetical protein [Leptospira limi]MCW7462826.1 hypothetical protein [Leptospira limi]
MIGTIPQEVVSLISEESHVLWYLLIQILLSVMLVVQWYTFVEGHPSIDDYCMNQISFLFSS